LVESYFDQLRKWITARHFSPGAQRDLRAYISDRLRGLRAAAREQAAIPATSICTRISHLIEGRIPNDRKAALSVIQEIRAATEVVLRCDENLARVPELEQLSDAFAKQGAAQTLCEEAESEFSQLKAQESELQHELDALKTRKLLQLEKISDASDAGRAAEYCSRSLATLAKFRSDLVRVRREQLEQLILDSFRLLSRKTDLVSAIRLEPSTMAVSLKTYDGGDVLTQQLSAGERQLLAVAMLWGLARATGRPVPVVIDTPLGRLDGEHRRTIVERYFPDAGHQVILLSTDTEVDARFSELLGDAVAHRYLIGYDPQERSSSFIPGYFSRQ
jgi:DNA sulfur modification protein DndD